MGHGTEASHGAGRVCIIGAGPSGLSMLCWVSKLAREGRKVPEVICYEKQSNWGGLWNNSWRTGMDQFGEPVHGSMYRKLWANAPKECYEYPHFTFLDHFKKSLPSYPPRAVMLDYHEGRWNKEEVKKFVKFNTAVRDVVYNESTNNFTVVVKDLLNNQVMQGEEFDYVIIASGHYSTPNVPEFDGLTNFHGRVIHSHDYRNPEEFAGQKLLVIGSSYSAEDIALQSIKYGAESVICSYRTHPLGLVWPQGVEERPLVCKFDGNIATFKDGSSAEVDVVIMCTGYLHNYPFLREDLRLKSQNSFYPPNLYKGMVWTEGGDNKLFYLGAQNQAYTFTMFDICGLWAAKLIMGEISLPAKEDMERSWKHWEGKKDAIKNAPDAIDFQTEHVKDLVSDCGADFPYNLDVSEVFKAWVSHKVENIATYRDKTHTSIHTGCQSVKHKDDWMNAMDDSLQHFIN